jgi:hypothetical protein
MDFFGGEEVLRVFELPLLRNAQKRDKKIDPKKIKMKSLFFSGAGAAAKARHFHPFFGRRPLGELVTSLSFFCSSDAHPAPGNRLHVFSGTQGGFARGWYLKHTFRDQILDTVEAFDLGHPVWLVDIQ